MTQISEIIACPNCGGEPVWRHDGGGALRCSACGAEALTEGNVVTWRTGAHSATREGLFTRRVRSLFNPLSSPLLPFRYLTRHRVEAYYRRTLHDLALARSWSEHYLEGIAIGEGARVLDFGCGRGRNVALLGQLGFDVFGQDICANGWWERLPGRGFQSLIGYPRLPWKDGAFDLVLQVGVVHYLDPGALPLHLAELRRVVRPGGHLVMLEANSDSYGAHCFRKQIGRLYTLPEISRPLLAAGFELVDLSYEGYYASRFPLWFNFLRKIVFSRSPEVIADYRSSLAARTPPLKRGLWLLKVRRCAPDA